MVVVVVVAMLTIMCLYIQSLPVHGSKTAVPSGHQSSSRNHKHSPALIHPNVHKAYDKTRERRSHR